MAVRIRMKKMGRRHRPFFRISVMDSRSPRDGKTIEDIGHYDPMVMDKSNRVQLNMERLDYWLSVGAQPTEKVAALIKKVKTNKFGAPQAPPPMQAPKAPPEPAETAPEAPEGEAGETAEVGASAGETEGESS